MRTVTKDERLSKHVSHLVKGTAGLEPGDLRLIHGVVELNLLRRAIGVLQNTGNRLQVTRDTQTPYTH